MKSATKPHKTAPPAGLRGVDLIARALAPSPESKATPPAAPTAARDEDPFDPFMALWRESLADEAKTEEERARILAASVAELREIEAPRAERAAKKMADEAARIEAEYAAIPPHVREAMAQRIKGLLPPPEAESNTLAKHAAARTEYFTSAALLAAAADELPDGKREPAMREALAVVRAALAVASGLDAAVLSHVLNEFEKKSKALDRVDGYRKI